MWQYQISYQYQSNSQITMSTLNVPYSLNLGLLLQRWKFVIKDFVTMRLSTSTKQMMQHVFYFFREPATTSLSTIGTKKTEFMHQPVRSARKILPGTAHHGQVVIAPS